MSSTFISDRDEIRWTPDAWHDVDVMLKKALSDEADAQLGRSRRNALISVVFGQPSLS